MQDQPPKKRQLKAPARRVTAGSRSFGEETGEVPEAAANNGELGGTGSRPNNRAGTIRHSNGVLEWLDKEDFHWSKSTCHIMMIERSATDA